MTAGIVDYSPSASEVRDGERQRELLVQLVRVPLDDRSRRALRQEVIEAWLPLADRLAHRFHGRGVPWEDLIQIASLGLIKAVDRFDAGRGGDFVSFAVPTILGEIRRYFRDHTWDVRVPRRVQELRREIGLSRDSLTQQLGHTPSAGELAADLDVPRAEVVECLQMGAAYTAVSLDAPMPGGDQDTSLAATLGERDADLALAELRMTLGPVLARLPEREQQILRMRFHENRTQSEIADQIGVSQMHISRLLSRSLAMLRDALTDDEPDTAQPVEAWNARRRAVCTA